MEILQIILVIKMETEMDARQIIKTITYIFKIVFLKEICKVTIKMDNHQPKINIVTRISFKIHKN